MNGSKRRNTRQGKKGGFLPGYLAVAVLLLRSGVAQRTALLYGVPGIYDPRVIPHIGPPQ